MSTYARTQAPKHPSTDSQPKRNTPDFSTWTPRNLASFATDAYIRMVEQQEAIEQYRRDLRTAMQELRIATTNKDDWK